MSDRPIVQAQSWRPQRHERSIDPRVIRGALAAAGLVAFLGLGYGGYMMAGRVARPVPVVEADVRPVRVRPDNPGGMQVAGAEEQIMGGAGSGQADTMAPPPEVPQPQVLRAQIEAARQPAPVPPPAQPVSLSAAPAPLPAPAISALPERRVAVPAPAQRAAAAPAAVGGLQVQLAALGTEAAAMAEWQRLAKLMPDLFASRRPDVQRADRDGKTYFRLRTGGFTNVAQATGFCTQIKAKGAGCSIASF